MSQNYKAINKSYKNILLQIDRIPNYDKQLSLNKTDDSYLAKLFDSFKNSKIKE